MVLGTLGASAEAAGRDLRLQSAFPDSVVLQGVQQSAAAWGDYDGDGDLDLVVTGIAATSPTIVSKILRNEGGPNPTFTDIAAGLYGVRSSSVAWGDYDNDGDLDLALAGLGATGRVALIYRNSGGASPSFASAVSLTGVAYGSLAWGDYDNDGDLDLLLTGEISSSSSTALATLYRSSGGPNPTFSAGFVLPGTWASSVAWGDYDNDGDLDFVLCGFMQGGAGWIANVYRNSGGMTPTFSIGAALPGVASGSAAWGDYDLDGDLDLLVTGASPDPEVDGITKIYRNSGGVNPAFPDSLEFPGVQTSSAVWGDADGDGDLDFAVSGSGDAVITRVLANGGGSNPGFAEHVSLPGVYWSSLAWGDCDRDGDLDLLVTGLGNEPTANVYRSAAAANTPPQAPTGLASLRSAGSTSVAFSWNAASDVETPSGSITYNLRVGTTPGGHEIVSAMSNADGFRRVPQIGNVNHRLEWTLELPPGAYYWSVQAVDHGFAGSPFAPEQTIVVTLDAPQPRSPAFVLHAARPNPFSRAAVAEYELPHAATVGIRIHDVRGRLLRTLADAQPRSAGRHSIEWDGRDENGNALRDGVYFCSVSSEGVTRTSRWVKLRP